MFGILLLATFGMIKPTIAYGTGAPAGSCTTMTPMHGTEKTDQNPYGISIPSGNITSKDTITVTIYTSGTQFKGFLLRPIPEGSGTFTHLSSSIQIACSGNGVTHSSPDLKNNVSVDWTPAPNFAGSLQFVATIVEDYDNFRRNIQSLSIQVISSPIQRDPSCGKSKGCLYDCDDSGCTFLMTWRDVATHVEFEITSRVSAGNEKWIALGLSTDEYMGDDSVVVCKSNNDNITVEVGYNLGYMYHMSSDSTYGIRNANGNLADTKLSCSFQRIKTPVGQLYMKNLTTPWFLLLAHGDISTGSVSGHTESPVVSPVTVDVQDTTIDINLNVGNIPSSTPSQPDTSDSKIIDQECGVSKGCFPDCSTNACTFLVTWRNQADYIRFEIASSITAQARVAANVWMAIGFSGDAKMGDDSVVVCMSSDGGYSTEVGYNAGYSYQVLPNKTMGLFRTSASSANGVFQCAFERAKNITSESRFFDMNHRWHLLFAQGAVVSGTLRKHSQSPIVSDGTVDFLSTDTISGIVADYTLTKVHGSLMVIAWVLCCSIGIIVARFFKAVWPNSKIGGQKVWFQIHRTCMVGVFLLTISGVVIIFVDIGGYSKLEVEESMSFVKAHPILGIVVTGLAILNPVMSLFRCSPDHKNRRLFNICHRLVGTSSYILAGITIVFGTYLDRSSLDRKATYTTTAYIVTFVIIAIALEINEMKMKNKVKKRDQGSDMAKMENSGKGYDIAGNTNRNDGFTFRKFALTFLILSMLGYSIAIMLFIFHVI